MIILRFGVYINFGTHHIAPFWIGLWILVQFLSFPNSCRDVDARPLFVDEFLDEFLSVALPRKTSGHADSFPILFG